jgi:hypothetical protein
MFYYTQFSSSYLENLERKFEVVLAMVRCDIVDLCHLDDLTFDRLTTRYVFDVI